MGLRSWVKFSDNQRNFRLKASIHADRRILRTATTAWKNTVYPLGLQVEWDPSIRVGQKESTGHDEVEPSPNTETNLRSQERKCFEQTRAATAQDWSTSSKNSSLVLLRLPLVGKRMRRVLYVWWKITKKEKRLRYIRDMLPQKVSFVWVLPKPCGTLPLNLYDTVVIDELELFQHR